MRLITALPLVVALVSGCASTTQELFTVSDWTKDGDFTNGIEGPAVDANGHLYAVNFKEQGTIGVIPKKMQPELYVTLPEGSTGNGIRFDRHGNMLIADYSAHNVLKVDAQSKKVSVYAHGPKMNQPNDIAIAPNGILFASDPNWANSTGNLWRVEEGKVTLLEADMGTTNGVEVSPDGRTLYVNESVQRKVYAYDLDASGNVSNKRTFIEFDDFGMDGMRCDVSGNLYIARYGAGVVAIVSPEGKLIREVKLQGKHPTNVAFGGRDGKQVFVTMQKRGAIETFFTDTPGRAWVEQQ